MSSTTNPLLHLASHNKPIRIMGSSGSGKSQLAEAIALNSKKHIVIASSHPNEILPNSVSCHRTEGVLGELKHLAFYRTSIQQHFWLFDSVPTYVANYPEAADYIQRIATNASPVALVGQSPLSSDWGLLRMDLQFFVNTWVGEPAAYIGVDELLLPVSDKKELKQRIYTRSLKDQHFALLSIPNQQPQILDLYASTPSLSGVSQISR